MAVDGSIIIDTKLDTSGINKGKMSKAVQAATAAEIKKMNANIKEQEKTVAGLSAALEKLMADYNSMIAMGVSAGDATLNAFDMEKITPAAAALDEAKAKLEGMREKTAELTAENEKLIASKKRVEKQMKKTTKTFEAYGKRIAMLARRVFLYSIVLKGLHGVLNYVKRASSTSTELTNALARMRGALMTAFQPLWETILPHLITFVNILTKAVLAVAAFFSWLTGKSLAQSAKNAENLNKQADAIAKTGKAADKAQKSLAAFDEINNISTPGESGGGDGASVTAPKFDFDNAELERMAELMKLIGDYIVAIGLGLATLGLARAFGAAWPLAVGLALAIAGLYLIVKSFIDMWNNGIDWQGLIMMLAGIVLLVGGLALAFGPVGAAIGAIVGGVALLVLGFKEWIETGELSTEAMTAIVAGLLLVGGAIALLTGGWIPLVIAAVAALVVVIIKYWDKIAAFFVDLWAKIKASFDKAVKWVKEKVIDPVVEFFKQLGKDITVVWDGIVEGIKKAINGIISFFEGMVNGIIAGLNWLIEKINSISISLPDWDILGEYKGLTLGFNIAKISKVSIPRLAQGTVVPRNKPFAAMLGDNKTETEVVSPLSTMKQALKEALMESGGLGGDQPIIILLDGEVVYKNTVKRNRQATIRTGRNPLLGV